jgi:hypothetical protein
MVAKVLKPLQGSLEVRVPYNLGNRSAWRELGLRPVWVKDGGYWQLARGKFAQVVRALANGLGEVQVTVEGHTTQQCDTRCWNADGDDCVCSCAGANHGDSQHGWIQVGETTVIKNEYLSQTYRVQAESTGPIFDPGVQS